MDTRNILVVDDNPQLRDAYRVILEAIGFDVDTASDGREALARMRAGPLPDLILLDLSMPKMNGWEFRAIQRGDIRLAGVPVVVMSADRLDPAEADLLATCHVLRKSAQADALMSVVMRAGRCRACLRARLMGERAAGVCQAGISPSAASASASQAGRAARARSL